MPVLSKRVSTWLVWCQSLRRIRALLRGVLYFQMSLTPSRGPCTIERKNFAKNTYWYVLLFLYFYCLQMWHGDIFSRICYSICLFYLNFWMPLWRQMCFTPESVTWEQEFIPITTPHTTTCPHPHTIHSHPHTIPQYAQFHRSSIFIVRLIGTFQFSLANLTLITGCLLHDSMKYQYSVGKFVDRYDPVRKEAILYIT